MQDPWEAAAAQTIIGGDSFVDGRRRALTDLAENVNTRSESQQRRKLQGWCSLGEVKAAVAGEYGCDEGELLRRHSRSNEARQVLLYMAALPGALHAVRSRPGAWPGHCRGAEPCPRSDGRPHPRVTRAQGPSVVYRGSPDASHTQ